eukprot:m.289168 g.289168  ORF g.289168 m.289168 type:complete len:965 (-) comp16222_c0_seq3:3346-6240(-)
MVLAWEQAAGDEQRTGGVDRPQTRVNLRRPEQQRPRVHPRPRRHQPPGEPVDVPRRPLGVRPAGPTPRPAADAVKHPRERRGPTEPHRQPRGKQQLRHLVRDGRQQTPTVLRRPRRVGSAERFDAGSLESGVRRGELESERRAGWEQPGERRFGGLCQGKVPGETDPAVVGEENLGRREGFAVREGAVGRRRPAQRLPRPARSVHAICRPVATLRWEEGEKLAGHAESRGVGRCEDGLEGRRPPRRRGHRRTINLHPHPCPEALGLEEGRLGPKPVPQHPAFPRDKVGHRGQVLERGRRAEVWRELGNGVGPVDQPRVGHRHPVGDERGQELHVRRRGETVLGGARGGRRSHRVGELVEKEPGLQVGSLERRANLFLERLHRLRRRPLELRDGCLRGEAVPERGGLRPCPRRREHPFDVRHRNLVEGDLVEAAEPNCLGVPLGDRGNPEEALATVRRIGEEAVDVHPRLEVHEARHAPDVNRLGLERRAPGERVLHPRGGFHRGLPGQPARRGEDGAPRGRKHPRRPLLAGAHRVGDRRVVRARANRVEELAERERSERGGESPEHRVGGVGPARLAATVPPRGLPRRIGAVGSAVGEREEAGVRRLDVVPTGGPASQRRHGRRNTVRSGRLRGVCVSRGGGWRAVGRRVDRGGRGTVEGVAEGQPGPPRLKGLEVRAEVREVPCGVIGDGRGVGQPERHRDPCVKRVSAALDPALGSIHLARYLRLTCFRTLLLHRSNGLTRSVGGLITRFERVDAAGDGRVRRDVDPPLGEVPGEVERPPGGQKVLELRASCREEHCREQRRPGSEVLKLSGRRHRRGNLDPNGAPGLEVLQAELAGKGVVVGGDGGRGDECADAPGVLVRIGTRDSEEHRGRQHVMHLGVPFGLGLHCLTEHVFPVGRQPERQRHHAVLEVSVQKPNRLHKSSLGCHPRQVVGDQVKAFGREVNKLVVVPVRSIEVLLCCV